MRDTAQESNAQILRRTNAGQQQEEEMTSMLKSLMNYTLQIAFGSFIFMLGQVPCFAQSDSDAPNQQAAAGGPADTAGDRQRTGCDAETHR